MEDLGGRESLPLTLFPLEPTLAATGWALLSAPGEGRTVSAQQSSKTRGEVRWHGGYSILRDPSLQPYLLRPSFLARSRLDRSWRQQMRKDRDMARMTMPLTTEANTATLRPRSSGLGMAVGENVIQKIYFLAENDGQVFSSGLQNLINYRLRTLNV